MSSVEDVAREVFTVRAEHYATSATHTDPEVLRRLVELAQPEPHWRALDIGTGTGNTAFALAPHVREVVGLDLTPAMLEVGERLRKERGIDNVSFEVGDAHHLPFEDVSFELVTCRRTAHHFSDIAQALREMHRVLNPHGRLVIDDRSVPDDDEVDALMQELDTLHDPSHIRQYRAEEWREMLSDAGFAVDAVEAYTQHRPLTSLTKDTGAETTERIHARLDVLDDSLCEAIDLRQVDGELHSTHWYVMVAAQP